mmetsp:Transcript_2440/g.6981  ORF Transcript_2440/g.6981 Transcript_2440/m.6981 type:complete len:280 (+) Transcript_2440:68-907(+)
MASCNSSSPRWASSDSSYYSDTQSEQEVTKVEKQEPEPPATPTTTLSPFSARRRRNMELKNTEWMKKIVQDASDEPTSLKKPDMKMKPTQPEHPPPRKYAHHDMKMLSGRVAIKGGTKRSEMQLKPQPPLAPPPGWWHWPAPKDKAESSRVVLKPSPAKPKPRPPLRLRSRSPLQRRELRAQNPRTPSRSPSRRPVKPLPKARPSVAPSSTVTVPKMSPPPGIYAALATKATPSQAPQAQSLQRGVTGGEALEGPIAQGVDRRVCLLTKLLGAIERLDG